jgi:FeS assembly protein IscX
MRWSDTEALARALHRRFPSRDPLTIRLPDVHRWVPELEGFEDSEPKPGPRDLERIQERWYRLYEQGVAPPPATD